MPNVRLEVKDISPTLEEINHVILQMFRYEATPARVRLSTHYAERLCAETGVSEFDLFTRMTVFGVHFIRDEHLKSFEVDAI